VERPKNRESSHGPPIKKKKKDKDTQWKGLRIEKVVTVLLLKKEIKIKIHSGKA